MLRFFVMAAIGLFIGDASAETRAFRDWLAVCDGGACYGRTSAGAASLDVKRGAAGGAEWELLFRLPGAQPKDAKLRLVIDGEPGPTLDSYDYSVGPEGIALIAPDVLRTLVPTLRNKGRLALSIEPGGGRPTEFSLSGMAATMLWIDERQGRVTGPVGQPARRAPGPAAVPEELVRLVAAEPSCDADERESPVPAESHKIDAERTLYIAPCWSAAYNFGSILALKPGVDGSDFQPLAFAFFSKRSGPTAERTLVNASYDPKTRVLTSFNKGRGVGDCGVLADWRWTKDGFKLIKMQSEGECRGRPPEQWAVDYEAR